MRSFAVCARGDAVNVAGINTSFSVGSKCNYDRGFNSEGEGSEGADPHQPFCLPGVRIRCWNFVFLQLSKCVVSRSCYLWAKCSKIATLCAQITYEELILYLSPC
jgi:hypothetical protein